MKRELLFLKHGYLNVAFLMLFGCCSVACSNEDDNPTPEPPKPVEVYQDLKVFQLNTWFGATLSSLPGSAWASHLSLVYQQ